MDAHLLNTGLASAAWSATGAAVAFVGYAYLAPANRLFLPVVSRGEAHRPTVALTFDDGPTPDGTTRVLDVLGEHTVKAAFFVIGANVRRHPELVARIHAEGHLVCNHSFDHSCLGALRSPEFWRRQISLTDEAIQDVIDKTPAFFRAPLGHKSPWMRGPLRDAGKTAIGWTRRAFDGIPMPAGQIVRRLSMAGPGEVLLLHDGRNGSSRRDPGPTIAALPQIISRLRGSGLELARLDTQLGLEPYLAARTGAGSSGIVDACLPIET